MKTYPPRLMQKKKKWKHSIKPLTQIIWGMTGVHSLSLQIDIDMKKC